MKIANMAAFAVGPAIAAFLSLFTLPFIAWFFKIEDVGRLSIVQLTMGLCVSLFSLQLHQSYVREYHEELNKRALFKSAVLPGLIFLMIFLLILWAMPISISDALLDINSEALTIMLIVSVFFSFLINFFSHTIRMEERGWAFSVSQILPKSLVFLFVPIIFIFNISSNFYSLMFINTSAIVLSSMALAWFTRKTWITFFKEKIDISLQIRMLKFSIPLVAGGVAYWGLTGVDRFFLKRYSGLDDLGVYAMATSIASSAMLFSTIFANIWHPTVYKWIKIGIDQKKIQIVIEGVLIFVSFIWGFFGLFSWVIPIFLPNEYYSLKFIIVACVSAPLLYMLSEATMVGIGISRKSGYSMMASIVALFVNLLFNFIFVPQYGIYAVSLVSLLSFFVFFIIRTESSAYLWYSFPRIKIYITIVSYLVFTFLFIIKRNDNYFFNFNLIWIIPLVITSVLFYSRIFYFINKLKSKF